MKVKSIGDKINELLELKEMTQADLARLAGVSTGHLSDICTNKKTSLTVNTLKLIADALHIGTAYFLEDNVVGPADFLPHFDEDERKFLLSQKSMPWVKLSKNAFEKGLNPEKIRQIISIMLE